MGTDSFIILKFITVMVKERIFFKVVLIEKEFKRGNQDPDPVFYRSSEVDG